jgi:HlyD family secretion protein
MTDQRMKKNIYVYLGLAFSLWVIQCNKKPNLHPQRKNIVETVYASGKIIADSEYTVYSLNAGTILKKLVKEGDTVKKGQLLYMIKNDAPSARAEAARAAYNEAQQNVSERSRVLNDLKITMSNAETKFINDSLLYTRRSNLWKQGIGAKNDVDNAYTAYINSLNQKKSAEEKYHAMLNDLNVSLANAKSQFTSAQYDLNNYFIRSESDGRVYQTNKEAGEAVKINEAMALLGKTSNRIIRLAVDQQDIDKIKPGMEVLLKTDITGNIIYHATVQRMYPMMNEADQTFRVDASFSDNADRPFTHSSVEANIIIQKKTHVLTVPRLAMISDDSITVKQDGKSKTIAVQTGIRTLDEVEILKGLSESSEIMIPSQK